MINLKQPHLTLRILTHQKQGDIIDKKLLTTKGTGNKDGKTYPS